MSGPSKDGDRYLFHKLVPIVPFGKLNEIIGSYDPDKSGVGKSCDEYSDNINRIFRTKTVFQIGYAKGWMGGDSFCLHHARLKVGGMVSAFEGVLRRDQPPHFLEVETLQCMPCYVAVPFMGRVE